MDKSRQIGDALSCSKTADGAHGLLTIRGVDPRTERMRDDQTGEKNKQGLAEQALGKKPVHSWVTAGVNMYPPPHTVLMILRVAGIEFEFLAEATDLRVDAAVKTCCRTTARQIEKLIAIEHTLRSFD